MNPCSSSCPLEAALPNVTVPLCSVETQEGCEAVRLWRNRYYKDREAGGLPATVVPSAQHGGWVSWLWEATVLFLS